MSKTFNATITKTHEFQASVASMLVRSASSYKGDFEFISDLQNIIAYNGDYADVFETNSRWVYENNQWVNTGKEILINPLSVEIVQVTGQSTTAVISQKGVTDALALKFNASDAGTAAAKNTGTAVGEIPIIGSNGKIGRYILPTANDSGYIGVVAGQNFANRNKEGATYHEVLIDSAGMAYAFYPLIDTSMSDSSINLVQNKVIKAYVDTAITTAISDTWGGSY